MLKPGSVIAETYVITRQIGAGGMGEVYEARHAVLPRRFAVKVMRMGSGAARFLQEAMVTTRLAHPNIVEVVDFKVVGEHHCLVMELLEGEDLAARMARGRLPPSAVLTVLRQVAAALGVAHRAGVVHRDLKPQNIFLARCSDGQAQVKVLDFGISKQHGSGSKLTSANMIVGSPHYMAPEQAAGRSSEVDPRTDVFALGVLTYEMLAGVRAFPGDSEVEVLHRVMYDDPPRLDALDPPWPAAVADAVAQALAKPPVERFLSAEAFVAAIASALGPRPDEISAARSRGMRPRAPEEAHGRTAETVRDHTAEGAAPAVAGEDGVAVTGEPPPSQGDGGEGAAPTVVSRSRRAAATLAERPSRRPPPDAPRARWPWLLLAAGLAVGGLVAGLALRPRPAAPRLAPPVPAAAIAASGEGCPAVCSGGCAADLCRVDCSARGSCKRGVTCPPGLRCEVTCGEAACGHIDGSLASELTARCGAGACEGVTGGRGPCRVTCGPNACRRSVSCQQSTTTDVTCAAGACEDVVCGRERATVRCLGDHACRGVVACASASQLELTCSGRDTCGGAVQLGLRANVVCSGHAACHRVQCQARGSCSVECSGPSSCRGMTHCGERATCRFDCTGASSCRDVHCVEQTRCTINCVGAGTCAEHASCLGCACALDCSGAGACAGRVYCPAGCRSCRPAAHCDVCAAGSE